MMGEDAGQRIDRMVLDTLSSWILRLPKIIMEVGETGFQG